MQATYKHDALRDSRLHGLYWVNTRMAMVLVSLDTHCILDANPAAEKLFGYRGWELAGLLRTSLHPMAERIPLDGAYRSELSAQSGCEGFHILRKDGTELPVLILSSGPFASKGGLFAIYGYCDASDREEKQHRFLNQNFAMAAYAGAASAFGKAASSSQLLQQVCEAIVRQSPYALAWIAVAEEGEDKRIEMAASAGNAVAYLDRLQLTWAENEPQGNGPLGICIRTAVPQIMNDAELLENFEPWRTRARNAGLRSAVALPIRVERGRRGALVIYSPLPGGFDSIALDLFLDLSARIGRVVHPFDRESPLNAGTAIRRTQAGMSEALAAISESMVRAAGMLGSCGAGPLRRVSNVTRSVAREMDALGA